MTITINETAASKVNCCALFRRKIRRVYFLFEACLLGFRTLIGDGDRRRLYYKRALDGRWRSSPPVAQALDAPVGGGGVADLSPGVPDDLRPVCPQLHRNARVYAADLASDLRRGHSGQ